MNAALLVLGLVVGLGFAAHGAQKLFGWFGGGGISGIGAFPESIGFRPGIDLLLLPDRVNFWAGFCWP